MAPTNTSSGLVPLPSDPSVSIYYSVDGPSDGSKPIIALSNSLAATTHLWDDFVATFRDEYTIVRYDARFHGNSPLSKTPSMITRP
jgi:pimeloyl-ACP methyl ester carboxylesterase